MQQMWTGSVARCRPALAGVLLAVALATGALAADIPGIIIKTNTQEMRGNLAWDGFGKQYKLTGGGVMTYVPLDQVGSVRTQPPAGLQEAIKAVQGGQYQGAPVAALEKIVNDYLMLEHDLPAMRWLAEAYVQRGEGKAAAPLFEKVMASREPATVPADVLRAYWSVLLAAERYPDLRKALGVAVEQGDRPTQAAAQVLRGAMDKQRKEYRTALVDGYLRAIVLFQDVREVQPEALAGAATCFEELGESANAEKMRKKLLAEFPDSSYSKLISSGG